jgi:hypothetical protein
MRSFIAIALASAVSATWESESDFMSYITQFGKSYKTLDEYMLRFKHFARNHAYIIEHNLTEPSYYLGHNQFSDWTDEEYSSILTYMSEEVEILEAEENEEDEKFLDADEVEKADEAEEVGDES